jgi:hypothetical protein
LDSAGFLFSRRPPLTSSQGPAVSRPLPPQAALRYPLPPERKKEPATPKKRKKRTKKLLSGLCFLAVCF